MSKWRWLVAVLLLVLAAGAVLASRWYNSKPPPAAAGVIRLCGEPGGGIPPPRASIGTGSLVASATFSHPDSGPTARIGFLDDIGGLPAQTVRKGDVFTVRGIQLRVVEVWYKPLSQNCAVDLEMVSATK